MKSLLVGAVLLFQFQANALVNEVGIGQGQIILADTFNRTLYVFDPDTNGVPSCSGQCAEIWPPYLISKEEAQSLQAPLSAVARGGNMQLLINSRPVYTYFLDRKPTDILGDGLGGVWHIISAGK